MPTTNARKHVIPAPGDTSVNRATIFQAALESVRDVVPVANATARAQLVADLSGVGQAPSSAKPLVVYRHDAPGLHRLEWTVDGTVWVPSTGVLAFPNKAAADAWATANSGYLTVGDRARVASIEYVWTGTIWGEGDWAAPTLTSSWVNFGAPYRPAEWRTRGGEVKIRGAVKSGGLGAGNPIMTLPAGYRPAADEQFMVMANAGFADLRVDTAGRVYIAAYYAGGTNQVVALNPIRFEV